MFSFFLACLAYKQALEGKEGQGSKGHQREGVLGFALKEAGVRS